MKFLEIRKRVFAVYDAHKAEFDAINKSDTERYGKILKDVGISPQ